MATARAVVLEDVERMQLQTFPLPDIGPDEGLLRVEMVGICGTDYKYYHGKLAARLPMILGHEILGHLAAIGDRAALDFMGQRGQQYPLEKIISHVYPLDAAETAIQLSGGNSGEEFVKAALVP